MFPTTKYGIAMDNFQVDQVDESKKAFDFLRFAQCLTKDYGDALHGADDWRLSPVTAFACFNEIIIIAIFIRHKSTYFF